MQNRDLPYTKYLHDSQERFEVLMHRHLNGQLNFLSKGAVQLLTPDATWVVPWNKLVWIPPGQLHSVKSEKLSQGWKIMISKHFAKFLPKSIAVLKTSNLLVAALGELPTGKGTIHSQKLKLLIEVIKHELRLCESESFAINLPKSPQLEILVATLLNSPEDLRGIDAWAKSLGMSRRAFTRFFLAQTGSPFNVWKKNLVLSKGLSLLAEGRNVSEVSDQLKYAGPSAFIFAFRKKYGVSPRKFIR